jgi:excinuclease ABC subunit C
MAEDNADFALQQRIAERATQTERLLSVQDLLDLETVPDRIECFDISHTQGEATVGSCVVFGQEGPIKSNYRRFNVAGIEPGDDYGAMEQVLRRRYQRAKDEGSRLPDLILVDGGRGQLNRACAVLESLDLSEIEVAGVAKGSDRRAGFEVIVLPHRDEPLSLGEDSPGLHLIQQIRDEAHRFAITGHRQRRESKRRSSTLQDIPGIGPKLRQRLLTEFGGLQGVSRAGVEDLMRVKGLSRTLAQSVYDSLRGGG